MPLYTYIATFKGASYVAQGSYSNFRGFVSAWSGDLPDNALPSLTVALRKELSSKERWPRLFRQFPGFAKWDSAGLMSV